MPKMTWEEALSFDHIIKNVAVEWSHRVKDISLVDDIYQEIIIGLVNTVDITRAKKDVNSYVRTAAWRIARFMLLKDPGKGAWEPESLDFLMEEKNFQVDEDGRVREPEPKNWKVDEER